MELNQLTNVNLISLNLDLDNKVDVIKTLIKQLYNEGKITSEEEFFKAIMAREELSPTGIEAGLAIPHGKSDVVKEAAFAVATIKTPLEDWESVDESNKVDLVFLLAIPSAEAGSTHLELLAELMTKVANPDFMSAIKNAKDPIDLYRSLGDSGEEEEEVDLTQFEKTIVAVTACPAGIAHTYMAAEALSKAGKEMGVAVYVEKQGANGIEDRHTTELLKKADAAIFAVSVAVKEEDRFKHLPTTKVPVAQPLKDAKKVIQDALDKAEQVGKGEFVEQEVVEEVEEKKSAGAIAKEALMTGISYIIPLIVAGGMIASLALMIFGVDGITEAGTIGFELNSFGQSILALMVPLLAGYMAFSLGDKVALVPGIAGGIAANTVGGGFIGGIIAGFIAGYFMRWFKKYKVNKTFVPLMNMLVYPLVGTLVVGLLMLFVIGGPIAFINESLINALNSLSGSNAILLAIVIGVMTSADLGGPINKAAFAFSLAAIEAGNGLPYAAFAVAKCSPGVALTIATLIKPKMFTQSQQELGKTSWIMGLGGITEAAIPYAISEAFIAIPSFMIGGAVGAVISYVSGCSLLAAGGSIFTMPITSNPIMWTLALASASVISGVCIIIGKIIREKRSK